MAKQYQPGDKVELAQKGTSFFDPATGLELSIDGNTKLGDKVGVKTHRAILSGRLLVVAAGKGLVGGKAAEPKTPEPTAPEPKKPAKKAAATEEK